MCAIEMAIWFLMLASDTTTTDFGSANVKKTILSSL